MKILAFILTVCAVTSVGSAQAIQGFTGGTTHDTYWGSWADSDTVGWAFTVTTEIAVTDLGVWVDSDGMQANHTVGIWSQNYNNPLAAVTITPDNAVYYDGFNYRPISPISLSPGETYIIGATYMDNAGDYFINNADSLTMSPEVTWLEGRVPVGANLGFARPGSVSNNLGFFGPNFNYVIPGPGSMALLGLGGLALCRRRRH